MCVTVSILIYIYKHRSLLLSKELKVIIKGILWWEGRKLEQYLPCRQLG